jgi:ChrR Cupin-like domain
VVDAKPAIEFTDPSNYEWHDIPGEPGMSQRVLAGNPATGNHTRMLRFAAGTVTGSTLNHEFWEEVWIVDGAITDLRLDKEFTAGMFACRPPGMPHGPWSSPDGCVTFEVRYAR